jgi:tripartite motif-containing protein 71
MRKSRVAVALTSAVIVGSALAVGVQARAASSSVTVTFLKTLAGPSQAAMYSSGLIWDPGNPLCTHATGCIVVADTGFNRISVFDPGSPTPATPVVQFGAYGSAATGAFFNTPRDVAVDGAHHIYVADAANSRIQAFGPNGNWLWTAAGPGKLNQDLNTPIGISYDAVNNQLIVADTGHSEVKAYNPSNGAYLWKSPTGLLLQPREARRGPDGGMWVADYEHQVVRAFQVNATTGVWSSSAYITLGVFDLKGGHGNGQLNFPYNVAFSPDGKTAYVSDTGNERIARWDISQSPPVWLPQFGTKCNSTPSGCPDNEFLALRRVTVDPASGNVWAADFWGSGIHEFFPSGSTSGAIEIDGKPAPLPGFAEAYGVAVGSDGTTYGVDRLNQRVEAFSAGGTFLAAVGSRGVTPGKFSWPETAAVAPDGSVWVGDTRNDKLQHFGAKLSGKPTSVGSSGSGAAGQFNRIDGITVDAAGVVWAADTVNNRIQSYTPSSGKFAVFPASQAVKTPDGVAVSSSDVYVADTGNNRIVEFSKSTGSYVGQFTGLNQPQGVALAPDGTIWVADTFNNQIVHLSSSLVNLGDTFGCSDGGTCPASQQFYQPHSLALSPTGSVLFVADTYNNRIQEFTLS